MIRDMRDLRGGVTRQLIGQDKRLTGIEDRIGALEQGVAPWRRAWSDCRQDNRC